MMMRQWLIFCFLVLAAQPGHGIRGGGISSLEVCNVALFKTLILFVCRKTFHLNYFYRIMLAR